MFKLTSNELQMVMRDFRNAKSLDELNRVHDTACIMCIGHGTTDYDCNDCCPIARCYERRKEQIENPKKVKWVIAWTNPES